MSAAAFNDAVAWCLLTVAIALASSSGNPMYAVYMILILIAYFIIFENNQVRAILIVLIILAIVTYTG